MRKINKGLIYGIAILCWTILFQACDLFETKIVEDRTSFIKIYNSKNQISVDYLAKVNDGFLLFASEDVTGIGIAGSSVKEVSEWGVLKENYTFNSLDSFTKVVAIDKGTGGFVYLGKRNGQDFIMQSTTFANLTADKFYGIPPEEKAIDFDVLPNGNIIVLSNKADSLAIDYFDANLNLIWNRVYSIKKTEGKSIKYDEGSNSFFILGFTREDSSANLFILKINDEGNELNIRFGSEFFNLQNDLPTLEINGKYNPQLLDLGTHFIIIDRGENYKYPNEGAKFQAYSMPKSMDTIAKLNTTLNLSTIETAQVLDNEILISGTKNNDGIIRKLDAQGQVKKWDNGNLEVIFETNITTIINALNTPQGADPKTFKETPTFIPGNIVKNNEGGYSMLGAYGIFNQDEFEQIMTLFKIRENGDY